jgi:hypothetical protein
MSIWVAPDDPRVTGASMFPIKWVVKPAEDNAVILGTLDGVPFWTDGFYMERGQPPEGTHPHPRMTTPFAMTLEELQRGGMYVPVMLRLYMQSEEECIVVCNCERDEDGECTAECDEDDDRGPLIAAVMEHEQTHAPIVAIDTKYLNRIRTACPNPSYRAAHSFGFKNWPLIAYDGDAVFAVVMPIYVESLAADVADAERIEE